MKIVFLDAMTLGECDLSCIEKLGTLISYPYTHREDILKRAKEAIVIITNKVVLDKELLQQLPCLKLICIAATGTNNVDLKAAQELNIAVKNVAGYSTASVAQHTIALALGIMGKISSYDAYVKSKEYSKSPIFVNLQYELCDIEGKKWGIIGMGAIGRKVAHIVASMGATVSYYSTSGTNMQPYPQQSLKALLKESDIISIHAPLNEQTKGLIQVEELNILKDKAIIINVGRGGIINENDLAQELIKREIYAALDVFEQEPMPASSPLLSQHIPSHRVLFSPHVAWGYVASRKRLINAIAQNIQTCITPK